MLIIGFKVECHIQFIQGSAMEHGMDSPVARIIRQNWMQIILCQLNSAQVTLKVFLLDFIYHDAFTSICLTIIDDILN